MNTEEILGEAQRLVSGDRVAAYGDKLINHNNIRVLRNTGV